MQHAAVAGPFSAMTLSSSTSRDLDAYVEDLVVWLESDGSSAVSHQQREAVAALIEAMLDIADREVSAAEAAMAETLRTHVRIRVAAHTEDEARDLRIDLRVAVIDLDHGLDLDVDNVGSSLSDAALWLHADLEAETPRLDGRVAEVLLRAAAEIEHARSRDRAKQANLTGPIEVRRPGLGGVLLTAEAAPVRAR